MLTINQELSIFIEAILSGIIIVAAYNVLRVFRRLIVHGLWAISLEDMLFWLGTSIFLFVKMYETSNGSIRWFFVIGVLVGVIGFGILIKLIQRFHSKIKKKLEN